MVDMGGYASQIAGFSAIVAAMMMLSWCIADSLWLPIDILRRAPPREKPKPNLIARRTFLPLFITMFALAICTMLTKSYNVDPRIVPGHCGDDGVDVDKRDGKCYRNLPPSLRK